jgi:hypothetical protein
MANFGDLRLTVLGTVLQGKAQTGTELRFTRVAIGDGELPDGSSLEDLTALINEKMSVAINEIILNNDLATLTVAFSNSGLTSGFYIRELGIFANDPDVGEILYAVANAGVTPDYLPAAGANIVEEIFEVVTTVGSATNVTAIIDNSLTFVTHQQFTAHHHTPGTQAQIEAKDVVSVSKGLITAENVQSAIHQTADMLIPAGDNYILKPVDGGYGGKFAADGLNLNITPLEAVIGRKYHAAAASTLSLNPRKASYVYAAKNPNLDSASPNISKYDSVYPATDTNTVARYIFNTTGNISNTAVGNGLAVVNDLVKNGTITQVDGWADYAMQGDGSTGYYVSSNATGFPTGAQERELDIVFTVNSLPSLQILGGYGGTGTNQGFYFEIMSTGEFHIATNSTHYDTGFIVETGKTYFANAVYNGSALYTYINGVSVANAAAALTTAAGNAYIFHHPTGYLSNITMHYFELRNKCRTPQQIAQISNKLCLPCHYTGYQASYPPNPTDAGYHCWKFDDASGNTVTDEAETMNGTVTGTTIVDSEIGLGKARKFKSTADYISWGNYSFPAEFTFITVCTLASYGSLTNIRTILSNRNSTGTNGVAIQINQGKFDIVSNGEAMTSSFVPLGKPVFLALTIKVGVVTFYLDSAYPSDIGIQTFPYTGNLPMYTGKDAYTGASGYCFDGSIKYLAIIPRQLSQPEIAQYYNALMKQSERTLIDDCLPANSISLGFARTDSTKVIEYNDTDYKYMRNEGATKTEGNKRVFLGWKYFSGSPYVDWPDVIGTRRVKLEYKYAEDAIGKNESPIDEVWVNNVTNYGIQCVPTSNSPYRVQIQAGGIVWLNGVWKTSGYIGAYCELL